MKLGRQWDERLKIWDEAFVENLYRELGELSLSGFTTKAQLTWQQASKQAVKPFPCGTAWGTKWEYGWFRTQVTVPESAAGERLMLHLGAGPEMLVFVNGKERGSIDRQHNMVELTAEAVPGEKFDILAEVYAGHGIRPENGGLYARNAVPVPEPPKYQCIVGKSHFGVWREDIFQCYADYHTLYELWKTMSDRELRTMKIGEALQQFTYIADFEAEEPERSRSILRADELLKPLLESKNGDTVPEYTIFGQSHLDLAWLWTMEETKRKSARTYSNQIRLMERYPQYKFLLCSPPVLENIKTYYPGLYEQIRERVMNGQFLPEGAVYVESDTNLVGGESLIRQFIIGKRWFREEFGTDSRLAWMPDTFGFTGAMPQIMAGCGVPYFATQKLLRCDPECEQFPYNVFWWEGIDGTKILSHIYKKNNAVFNSGALKTRWEEDRNQKQEIDSFLFPFGYGDGGGGPTEIMIETANRCADLEGAPRCTMESPVAFFERLEEKDVRNTYYGELYLAWHRGTYTAQSEIKRGVRKAEYAVREAEYLAGLMRLACGYQNLSDEKIVLKKLEELWKLLLVQEFHDILPGTSIQRVNEETREILERIISEGRQLAGELLRQLAGEHAVFNSLSWERSWKGLRLPACGYLKAAEPVQDGQQPSYDPIPGDRIVFSNDFYRAEIDGLGQIVSLTDRKSGHEYAAEPLNAWRLYRDVNVDYDAWELGCMYEEMPEKLEGTHEFLAERVAGGGIDVTVTRRESYFTATQRIHLSAESPRIDFETEIDWHERHRILKVDFPTTVYTKEVLEEIQFGYIKRPTHRSRQYERDLYETSHHKYAALTDGENGLAVLNDCKYGISAQDSRLSLTLLRAPVIPDMTADMGIHKFTYSILPFSGAFAQSRVTEEAYECNVEVTQAASGEAAVPQTPEAAERVSFFAVEGGHVVLETCKPAFDREKGVVLRLYESKGCAGTTVLTVPDNVDHVYACNMLEETAEELTVREGKVTLRFRAFEIKTLMMEG